MQFRFKELMVVATADDNEMVMDTCCAASCSACTCSCSRSRAPTPTISPDDGPDRSDFLNQLKIQLRDGEERRVLAG
jgi:hypothetical protein